MEANLGRSRNRTENPEKDLHSISVNIPVVILYTTVLQARCLHWGELGKGTWDFSVVFPTRTFESTIISKLKV